MSSRTIRVKGEPPTPNPKPFSLDPKTGSLEGGGKCTPQVSLDTLEAVAVHNKARGASGMPKLGFPTMTKPYRRQHSRIPSAGFRVGFRVQGFRVWGGGGSYHGGRGRGSRTRFTGRRYKPYNPIYPKPPFLLLLFLLFVPTNPILGAHKGYRGQAVEFRGNRRSPEWCRFRMHCFLCCCIKTTSRKTKVT